MGRNLAGLTLLALCGALHAAPQDFVPVPAAARSEVLDLAQVDSVGAEKLNLSLLAEEDVTRDRLGLPPRFAFPRRVSITPADRGTWEDLGDGWRLWRLRVLGGEGTTSLNLGFTRFRMPAGGRLLLYSMDGAQTARPFTAADNEEHGQLWTPVVLARDLVVELTVPEREEQEVELELGWINQGYRGFGTVPGKAYEKSGSCNLDIACLNAGDPWLNQARAVGTMTIGGSASCTGSLVNNTAEDNKMYFITARHCRLTAANAASLVVYWNYQNSFCRPPGSAASGQLGDGQRNQFHSGALFRAAYDYSDVTLVELDDPPVPAYNHHWAGWDRWMATLRAALSLPARRSTTRRSTRSGSPTPPRLRRPTGPRTPTSGSTGRPILPAPTPCRE